MFVDGYPRHIPEDPWHWDGSNFNFYQPMKKPLRDPTCKELARYVARIVSW